MPDEGVSGQEVVSTFIGPADPRWSRFVQLTPHDFYHLPCYSHVTAKYESATPVAFYAGAGESSFLLPLLIRAIPEHLGAPKWWSDAISPYGYPGPLLHNASDSETVRHFLRAFQAYAVESDIVSAFVRSHPLLNDAPHRFRELGEIVMHGETVYIDLRKSADEIWSNLMHGHREGIRRVRRQDFTVEFDSWHRMDGFIAAYQETMERVSASAFYRFPTSYFAELREALGDRVHLCTVHAPNGEVASGSLFTLENGIAQDHLAATTAKYVRSGPSKLMTYSQAIWLQSAGATLFHLGGGVSSHADSLFYFKSGFSNLRANFWTCSAIFDEDKYTWLVRAAENRVGPPQNYFFPAYR